MWSRFPHGFNCWATWWNQFWVRISTPEMGPQNATKTGPAFCLRVSRLCRTPWRKVLRHMPQWPRHRFACPLVEWALLRNANLQLGAMELLLPMQKSIHRRRGNTMRNVHISDPFSCCSSRQKFLRAPRSLRIQCSKFCFGNGQEKFFYQGLGGIPRRLWVFDCAQHASHTMAQVTAAIRQDMHCNCSLTGCYSKASMFPSGSAPRKPLVHLFAFSLVLQ